jgi:hypothetical protein
MDDLKLFAKDQTELNSLLTATKSFSDDIQMTLGVEKCAILHVKRGKIQSIENLLPNQETIDIPYLQPPDTYKYLGFHQALLHPTKTLKEKISKAFYTRVRKVLSSSLNAKNKIAAINTWCVPILTYTFGVIPWSQTEIEAFDRQVRVLMTEYRIHHPKSAMERLYLPRNMGGRGLINLQAMRKKQITNLKQYFNDKSKTSALHKAIVQADLGYSPLNLSDDNIPLPPSNADNISRWHQKALHGRFAHSLDQADKKASTHWLQQGTLYGETEGFMFAIQDQVIPTRNYQKFIEKLDIPTDHCRLCNQQTETIQHLTSGCSTLANTEYLHRHNFSCKIVHQYLAKQANLIDTEVPYYQYEPKPVLENNTDKLYWDRPVITDRTILANRPDIIWVHKNSKSAVLIDLAHPNDHNLNETFSNKIIKYTDLADEIKQMWKLDSVIVVPIVISVNGLIHPKILKFSDKINLPTKIVHTCQRSVVLETCRIVRKVLNQENRTFI